jgi:hypothetical protein
MESWSLITFLFFLLFWTYKEMNKDNFILDMNIVKIIFGHVFVCPQNLPCLCMSIKFAMSLYVHNFYNIHVYGIFVKKLANFMQKLHIYSKLHRNYLILGSI